MWEKIKNFFKTFYWLFLIPIVVFILSKLFGRDTSYLNKKIKEKKQEIKKEEKEIEKEKKKAETKKEELEETLEDTKKTQTQIDTKSELRDKQAEEFFK